MKTRLFTALIITAFFSTQIKAEENLSFESVGNHTTDVAETNGTSSKDKQNSIENNLSMSTDYQAVITKESENIYSVNLPDNESVVFWSTDNNDGGIELEVLDRSRVKVKIMDYGVNNCLYARVTKGLQNLGVAWAYITSPAIELQSSMAITACDEPLVLNYLPEGATLEWEYSDEVDVYSYNDIKGTAVGTNYYSEGPWYVIANVTTANNKTYEARRDLERNFIESLSGFGAIKTYENNQYFCWTSIESSNNVNFWYEQYRPYKYEVAWTVVKDPDCNVDMSSVSISTDADKWKDYTNYEFIPIVCSGRLAPGIEYTPSPSQQSYSGGFEPGEPPIPAIPDVNIPDTRFKAYFTLPSNFKGKIIASVYSGSGAVKRECPVDLTTRSYNISPNPVSESVTVSRDWNGQNAQIELYSNNALVKQASISATEYSTDINMNDMPKGSYIIRISNGNTLIHSQVIMKE